MDPSPEQNRDDPGKRFGLALFYFLTCAAIAGGVTAVRLALWDKGMSASEALAYQIATLPGAAAVEAQARTFAQQPLYYLLAHHWMRVTGESLFSLRLFSALWGAAWLMLLYPAGAWISGGRRTGGWLAMAVAAVSPFSAYISLLAGPDAMLAALALASFIPFLEFTRDKTPAWAWPAWGAATLFLLLTHPLGVAVPLFQAAVMALLGKDKSLWFRRSWFALAAAVILLFALLRGSMPPEEQRQVAFTLPESMKQLQLLLALAGLGLVNGGPPSPLMTFENYTALSVFSCLATGMAFAWALLLRRAEPVRARVLILFAAVPAAVMFLASASFKSAVLWNNFAFFSSAAYLLIVFALVRGRSRSARAALAAMLLIVNIAGFQAYVRAPHLSSDWRGAFEHAAKHSAGDARHPETLLSLAPPEHRPLTAYYAQSEPGLSVTAARVSPIDGRFETAPSALAAQAAHSKDCFWILIGNDTLEKEMPRAWRKRFFNPRHGRKFRSVFTNQDLFVEQLCAKSSTKSLRAMSLEHFTAFLLATPETANPLDERYARANFFFEKGYLDMAEREMLGIRKQYGHLRGISLNLCFISLARGRDEKDHGRLEQALPLCLSAKEDEPQNAYIDSLIGEVLFHLERYADCRAPLETAIGDKALCRDNAGACLRSSYFLGAALYRLGEKEAALPHLEKAATATDIGPRASYLLGVAYYELGYPEDAIPHLKLVIGAQPFGDHAVRLLKQIETENPDLFKKEQRGRFQIESP